MSIKAKAQDWEAQEADAGKASTRNTLQSQKRRRCRFMQHKIINSVHLLGSVFMRLKCWKLETYNTSVQKCKGAVYIPVVLKQPVRPVTNFMLVRSCHQHSLILNVPYTHFQIFIFPGKQPCAINYPQNSRSPEKQHI